MGLLSKFKIGVDDELLNLLANAQKGDMEAREYLIKKYTPFILKVVSKVSGRYIHLGQDDEASIGLLAFDEAINSFKPANQSSFLSFSELVIKRRLIDYFRKEKRGGSVTYLPFMNSEEDEPNSVSWVLEGRLAFDNYSKEEEAKARRDEIMYYNQVLGKFDLSFRELVEISPKHQDARINAIKVAKLLAEDKRLKDIVLTKKVLPLKDITHLVEVSRKTLERNRKYIIAVFLIYVLDLTYLKEYLKEL